MDKLIYIYIVHPSTNPDSRNFSRGYPGSRGVLNIVQDIKRLPFFLFRSGKQKMQPSGSDSLTCRESTTSVWCRNTIQ